jgi:oligopeptide transport system permease protein
LRNLVPFDFAQLGILEFVWLIAFFGGLSVIAPARGRLRTAIWTYVILFALGWLRFWALKAPEGNWDLFGPIGVVPLLGAAVVGVGALGLPRVAAWVCLGITVLGGLLGAFGGLGLAGIVFLACIWFVLAAALDESERLRGLLRRKLAGPLTSGHVAAIAFVVFCVLTHPFGWGFVGGLWVLSASWLVFAVLAQGQEMRRYVKRRLLGAPAVLFVLVTLAFFMMRAAPGGPFDKDKALEPAIEEAINAKYHLDQPLFVQFRYYMVDLVWDGDLGPSFKHKGRTVGEIIAHHAPHSARLGLAAVCVAVLFGVTAGLVSGIRQNSIFDYSSMAAATLGLALPTFIVGPMLVLVFAMKLDWFRVSGWDEFPRDLILPAVTLALPFMARVARLTRAGMLEVVNQDYIRTARAKGLSEPVIVLRHTLKGTLLPVVSFLGPGIAQLLTGSLVVEQIFGVPGLGNEFVQSALNRDYGVAMGLVLVFGTLLIVFNLIVDIVYAFLDPRIRHG